MTDHFISLAAPAAAGTLLLFALCLYSAARAELSRTYAALVCLAAVLSTTAGWFYAVLSLVSLSLAGSAWLLWAATLSVADGA